MQSSLFPIEPVEQVGEPRSLDDWIAKVNAEGWFVDLHQRETRNASGREWVCQLLKHLPNGVKRWSPAVHSTALEAIEAAYKREDESIRTQVAPRPPSKVAVRKPASSIDVTAILQELGL